ncbi:MAG: transcriptional repressor [Candidatus Didemnitutus sp.]|nr:transcriptional repressor [Candidatus Didemnitutus sp.]
MIAATQSNHPLAGVRPAPTPTSLIEAGCARLRETGFRITKPRIALLEALAQLDRPVPIEQLHQQLTKHPCDLVTVYRCLSAFERVGIVRRSFLHNGTSLYELSLGNTAKHYHIVCRQCGGTERVDYFPVEGIERMLRERGYTELSHLVEFFGTCPRCVSATRTAAPTIAVPTTPSV